MKGIIVPVAIALLCGLAGCNSAENPAKENIVMQEKSALSAENEYAGAEQNTEGKAPESADGSVNEPQRESLPDQMICKEGTTLRTRIRVPEGYTRTEKEADSLAEFLRNYTLKEDGSEVLLYDGSPKGNQNAHVAVFALPLEEYDLQQCADSVMRMYAEYYWSLGQYDKIAFHFTNGFLTEYSRWRQGYRINVEGNDASWVESASYDDSYECFVKYMKIVFNYAGTLSMESEARQIEPEQIDVGDVFLNGGSPGHVVMVVDVCEDANGRKAFLLAQGYMPAQEFHVLKNNRHTDDPWYYQEEVTYPFETPEYIFREGALKRLSY